MLWVGIRKGLCERNAFGLQKSWRFLLMQSNPIKKSVFQHTKISISHCTQTNEQSRILSATTYCELAVQQSIFEKTSVLRLHYGNPFAPIQSLFAGALWAKPVSARAAGNFCEVSSGRALNRPRSPEVRKPLACFLVTFCTMQKVTTRSPSQGAPRFRKP